MLRRQTRLRREFLYTKSLEQKERQIHERKQRVKDLLAKGKEVPRGQGVGEREGRMDDGGNGESRASSSFFLGRVEGGMGRGWDWMGCVGGERKVWVRSGRKVQVGHEVGRGGELWEGRGRRGAGPATVALLGPAVELWRDGCVRLDDVRDYAGRVGTTEGRRRVRRDTSSRVEALSWERWERLSVLREVFQGCSVIS